MTRAPMQCDVCGMEPAEVFYDGERRCLGCAPPCPENEEHTTRFQHGGNNQVSLECEECKKGYMI